MARRTLTNFDSELHLALGKRTDLTSDMRNFIIDSAYLYVANAIRHRELEAEATPTLSLNTDTVAVPTGMWFPELVKNTSTGLPIEQKGDIHSIEGVVKPSGDPSRYIIRGSTFLFDRKPTVNRSLKIWYVKKPVELTANDSSVLDEIYDQLIILYSIKFAFEELRDFDQAGKIMIAINVYAGQIKAPWRMSKTDDRDKRVTVRMR